MCRCRRCTHLSLRGPDYGLVQKEGGQGVSTPLRPWRQVSAENLQILQRVQVRLVFPLLILIITAILLGLPRLSMNILALSVERKPNSGFISTTDSAVICLKAILVC